MSDSKAIRDLLERRRADLSREIEGVKVEMEAAKLPCELFPYRNKISNAVAETIAQLSQIKSDLALGIDEILDDIRSQIALATNRVQLIARVLSAPIISPPSEDRLITRLIEWIHTTNGDTAQMPAACCDGDPAVWPFIDFTPLYYMPRLTRRGLLHLPLVFHEYGHVAYQCHRIEMDELVAELQEWIAAKLEPRSRRNDALARGQRQMQRQVVGTWYAWAQEFFCDAVGVAMSGPCYLHAFCSYLSRLEKGDFTLPREELIGSSHPVLWLRVRLISARARRLGFDEVADTVEGDWRMASESLGVYEDYYGFFENEWQPKIESIIDDMLIESGCTFSKLEDCGGEPAVSESVNFVRVLNIAWRDFLRNPERYADAEMRLICNLLGAVSLR